MSECGINMNRLARIAASSIGAEECVAIEKCVDGMYNKAYILTMDNGRELVANVPNPDAGEPHFTTASEVTIIDFMRNVLDTSAPEVYLWSPRRNDNPVGAEYIIVEKARGIPLVAVWDIIPAKAKTKIFTAVSKFHKSWLSLTFFRYGGSTALATWTSSSTTTFAYEKGEKVIDSRFAIGRATGRDWVDLGRARVSRNKGPWRSAPEYCRAVARRELYALQSIKDEPKQIFMICGPGLYFPSSTKKMAAVELQH
ncbi:MAG: hypothetical protein M1821_008957 [Bathelium mastoideum]|nr:MAG: hypothetical protein M1821_008957 [Bathelium mastoideum]